VKITSTVLFAVSILAAQSALAQRGAAPRTEVYHVHLAKAAPGKAAQLGNFLKDQGPNPPMKGHLIVLRHQDGDDWDYAVIEHLGKKATVDASTPPPAPAQRDAGEWHTDTFVAGPSWDVFAKAMGLDQAARTRGSVYVVSVYRALPGHREQLEKFLNDNPAPGDKAAGTVVLQHLEGGAWNYLAVVRYNSWADFGASEASSIADTNKGSGGWFDIRQHAIYHTDTLTDRIAP
jgi:hypothetical protein